MTLRYAKIKLERMRDAVAKLVPKPFLVAKPSQTGGQTVTKTATSVFVAIRTFAMPNPRSEKYLFLVAYKLGRVAQLGERLVRNEEVGGSSPPTSTTFSSTYGGGKFQNSACTCFCTCFGFWCSVEFADGHAQDIETRMRIAFRD